MIVPLRSNTLTVLTVALTVLTVALIVLTVALAVHVAVILDPPLLKPVMDAVSTLLSVACAHFDQLTLCLLLCMCGCMYACTCVCMCVCVCVCVYGVCVYVYVYMCVCVYAWKCVCIKVVCACMNVRSSEWKISNGFRVRAMDTTKEPQSTYAGIVEKVHTTNTQTHRQTYRQIQSHIHTRLTRSCGQPKMHMD